MKPVQQTFWIMGLLIFWVHGPIVAQFGLDRRQADQALKQGNYSQALTLYKKLLDGRVNDVELNYNAGNALYRLGHFEQALLYYERAYQYSASPKLKTTIRYNMANCYFRLQQFDKSAEMYKEVVLKNPYDNDARYNYEYVMKLRKKTSSPQKNSNKDRQHPKEQSSQSPPSGQKPIEDQKKKLSEKTPTTGSLSRKEAERLLDLLRNQELDYQRKNLKERMIQEKKTDKDW